MTMTSHPTCFSGPPLLLSRGRCAPQAHPAHVAPLHRSAPVGRAQAAAAGARFVTAMCSPSATESQALSGEREAMREEREAHLAAEAAALAARREEREAHLAAEAAALTARREEREATLAERMAALAETKERREDKLGTITAASSEKAAESSVKAAANGTMMVSVSALGVGATLLLAVTMMVQRGVPAG